MNQKITALVSKIKARINFDTHKAILIATLRNEGYTHVQDDTVYDSPAIPVEQWIREKLITF